MSKLQYIRTIKEEIPYEEKRYTIIEDELGDLNDKPELFSKLELIHGCPKGYYVSDYKPAKIVYRRLTDCTPIADIQADTKE